ncbi:Fic/DOC family protein [Heyndrickxia camelliae]|uniref:protein adenylyltransferase n=1 Tax=Heyndrickxia camelliae TaxID=1707093 RepID=A0A2N3LEN9_9BACI|nr:Fic family protein [Heyndrickxia camelliae]PKR83071.1 cell filamentation protein Fic [Heyndrickxia camelliae]
MSKYNYESKYTYPGTDVLINKFDIKDHEKLEKLETTLTFKRIAMLHQNPLYGSFGLKHLQNIHKYIFQDIYPFAGELREEQIGKGTTLFAHPLHLESYSKELFKQLKNEKYLSGIEFPKFIERMSYYLSEINMLHPFREGNGRTQREFLRLIAFKNGFKLDWNKIEREELLQASVHSVNDSNAFVGIFEKAIVNKQPDKTLIQQYREISKNNHEKRLL